MKTSTNRPEPLESRIAPARILDVGVPNNPNDFDYNEAPFVNTESAPLTDLIASAVGGGIAGVADTFYLRLSKGDQVKLFRFGGGASTEPFLIVNSGNIVAFFTDKNLDNEVQETEITGIAMGKGASFELRAALPGDVVANLDEKGTKDLADDSLIMDGLVTVVPQAHTIGGIRVGSSIGGSVDEGVVFQTAIETVVGGPAIKEVQNFSIATAAGDVGQSFRVGFGGFVSAPLPDGASALDVEAALNSLSNIVAVGGVTVTSAAPKEFVATFNLNGDQAELVKVYADSELNLIGVEATPGTAATPEVQSVDIGLLAGRTGTMAFSFQGATSEGLELTSSAAEIEAAINAMGSIATLGGVTVSGPVGGPFNITFNANGDQTDVFLVKAVGFSGTVVGGRILAAGNIANVTVAGGVDRILAGSAADGVKFDFFPKFVDLNGRIVDTPGGNGEFSAATTVGKAGPNITNVLVDRLGVLSRSVGSLIAGDGGEGANGGFVKQIEVRNDADGFSILAGSGGDSGTVKKKGGTGGAMTNVYIDGTADDVGNDQITIAAGSGGNSSNGAGGAGGLLSNVFVGFRLLNKKPLQTEAPLRDNLLIAAGDGGSGKIGGKGGAVSGLQVFVSTPDAVGDEIVILGGEGGDGSGVLGGRGGAGGAVTKSLVRNVDLSLGNDLVILAGDAGASSSVGNGAAGGLVQDLTLVARNLLVGAGSGSDGKSGGAGGLLKGLLFDQVAGVFATEIIAFSGDGGGAISGVGGKGGDATAVRVSVSDMTEFSLDAGAGGGSTTGRGGNGGFLKDIQVSDEDFGIGGVSRGLNLFALHGGAGGDGGKGGGKGGDLTSVGFSGVDIAIEVSAGNGGDALISGPGGIGGSIKGAELGAARQVVELIAGVPTKVDAFSTLEAGLGGDGAGLKGKGGLGGSISLANVSASGSGLIHAGDGGNGSGAAAGAGGGINVSGLFATTGDGEMIAGSAGLVGTRPAAGGSIVGKSVDSLAGVFAARNLTVAAGDGSNGGAGGSVRFVGFGSFDPDTGSLVPTPLGDINILGGDGSGSPDGKSAGAGGSIFEVNGAVSFTAGTMTTVKAGDGGATPKKGGAGGSITNLSLQRGGNPGVELRVDAGDAGDSPLGATGAKGGSISGFTMIDVSTAAIFRHLGGGDGGDAAKNGGAGGSVININVIGHDIGLRDGATYGYNSMGGIFVGAGGAAAKPGLPGSVTTVVADAIGSIAAGKAAIPQLANKVSNVYLFGDSLLELDDNAFLRGFPGGSQNDNYPGLPTANVVYSFGGDSTVPLGKDTSAATLAEQLNLLPSIVAAGGVSVNALLPTGYQITFNSNGDLAQILAEEVLTQTSVEELRGVDDQPLQVRELLQGSTELKIREIQTVKIDPLLLGRVTGSFVGNATAFNQASQLSGPAGASLLQGRLNLLPSVVAQGGVSVVSLPGQVNTFQITFGSPGDQPLFNFVGDNLPLGFAAELTQGAPAVKEVQRFTIFQDVPAGVNNNPPRIVSTMQLSFTHTTPTSSVTSKTTFLASTTTAAQLQTALNALPSIAAAGLVDVTQPAGTEGFTVTFRVNGNREPIYVLDRIVQGTVTQNVGVATTLVVGDATTIVSETQRIAAPPTGFFSITFQGESTGSIPAGATAFDVENALLALASIDNAGQVVVAGGPSFYDVTFIEAGPRPQLTATAIRQTQSVNEGRAGVNISNAAEVQNIPYDPNGDFTVNFPVALSAVETIKGSFLQGEKQVLDLAAVQATPGATFSLTFNGSSTAALAATATAAEIDAALDGLATIPAGGVSVTADGGGIFTITFAQLANQPGLITGTVNGFQTTPAIDGSASPDLIRQNLQDALSVLPSVAASGGVTVAVGTGNSMNVQFGTFGNKPSFTALNDVLEQQSVSFLSDGEFTLSFGGATTPRLPAGSTAADVEAALNALATIPVGGVTVSGGVNNDFLVTFNAPGDVTAITATQMLPLDTITTAPGTGSSQEIQRLTIPQRYVFDPATFSTANLVAGISDSTELDGHIFKWFDLDGDGQFESGEQPIDGIVAARSFSQILSSFIPEARFAGGEFTFAETTPGNVATNEVQTLFIKSDGYVLTFGGQDTRGIPGKANAAAISKALNALPAIIAAGGVSVTSPAANTFAIAFNTPGDREPILAPFFFDYNNIIF